MILSGPDPLWSRRALLASQTLKAGLPAVERIYR